jgi:cyclohexanone monooxygenase
VASAQFEERTSEWALRTVSGEQFTARFCVMATGCLSAPNKPKIAGLDDFEGATYHTAYWPHEGVDFAGERVGIIGTGSSAIQAIPVIAAQASHLFVFQRTPNFSVPARNQPLEADYVHTVKANYRALRERARQAFAGIDFSPDQRSAIAVPDKERQREFEKRWAYGGVSYMGSFSDLLFNRESNETAAEFVRSKIREIVRDSEVAEALSPHDIIGCKRLCVDTDYYATFNRPNVTLIDLRSEPIERIKANGVQTAARNFEIDALVLATGFDAMTGALNRIDIRGSAGRSLKEAWQDGPRTYLGLMVAGFPNLFTITGPGSPSVLTNMLPSIEHHVEWIADCLGAMRERRHRRVEPTIEAQKAWNVHVSEVAGGNLRSACSSWYVGANIPGKPRVFMPYIGGFPVYLERCKAVVERGYEGFAFA